MIFFFSLKERFIYLFKRAAERGQAYSPMELFTLEMVETAGSRPDQSQETVTPSRSCTCVAGSPSTWAIFCCCPRCFSRELTQEQDSQNSDCHSYMGDLALQAAA